MALSPLQLAYIGDSVYDLLVRSSLLKDGGKLRSMHLSATAQVNAVSQARTLQTYFLTSTMKSLIMSAKAATLMLVMPPQKALHLQIMQLRPGLKLFSAFSMSREGKTAYANCMLCLKALKVNELLHLKTLIHPIT